MSISEGQFLDLNAQMGRRSPPSSRPPRRAVVNAAPPDRSHVEGAPPEPPPPPAPVEEAEPVAKKKARTTISPSDKRVAVARVNTLVEAGEGVLKATAKVAKEFGVSKSAVDNWRKGNGLGAPGAKRKKTGKRVEQQIAEVVAKPRKGATLDEPVQPVNLQVIGEAFMRVMALALDAPVRNIVAEEIRRRLS